MRTMTPEALAFVMVQEQKLERLRDLRRADSMPPIERARRRRRAVDELAALNVLERRLQRGGVPT